MVTDLLMAIDKYGWIWFEEMEVKGLFLTKLMSDCASPFGDPACELAQMADFLTTGSDDTLAIACIHWPRCPQRMRA